VRLYRRKQQEARELLREQEEKWTAILMRQEEELERLRRTIAVTQPQPAPPSRQPADVPEPGDVPAAPRGLSVAEQAVELGFGGPCWWEDSPEKRVRDECPPASAVHPLLTPGPCGLRVASLDSAPLDVRSCGPMAFGRESLGRPMLSRAAARLGV
jgi:hypothetical protein